ncbi:Peroxidase [Thalictrum thalictroides]|uniref:Peroxidase n=1 Tax=Thalictrum thalictroides TaxID=46969 RepID=A0A7J6WJD4_THATH|nr:Peroxidase [Thalictrum thalictroides]
MGLFLAFITLFLFLGSAQGQGNLAVGFYSRTCPNAERIVASVVQEAVLANPRMAAVLLRLHFHDCFIQGCDGSILIEGTGAEKHAFGHQGVDGYEVIEKAKAQLEAACRGVVSCADIVAMAARDSVALSKGPVYQVPTGRRDGRLSNLSFAADMPEVDESVQSFKAKFLQRGLSEKDLVVLSAAHTIGTTACFFMGHRLYNFPVFGSDPTINPAFLPELKRICPKDGDVNVRLAMDQASELIVDDRIFHNIRDGFAVLESDAKLYTDPITRAIIDSYLLDFIFKPSFANDFAESMVKMGRIDVKTGTQGEIRRICKSFN